MKQMVQSFEKRTMLKDVESDKYQPHKYEITSIISDAQSSRDSQGQLPFWTQKQPDCILLVMISAQYPGTFYNLVPLYPFIPLSHSSPLYTVRFIPLRQLPCPQNMSLKLPCCTFVHTLHSTKKSCLCLLIFQLLCQLFSFAQLLFLSQCLPSLFRSALPFPMVPAVFVSPFLSQYLPFSLLVYN